MIRISRIAATALCLTPAFGFQTFEGDGFDTWKEEGEAFGKGPAAGGMVQGISGQMKGYADVFMAASGHGGDKATGSLTSPVFKIEKPYIHFLVAGGKHPGKTAVQLWVDGKVVQEATGENNLTFRKVAWSVNAWRGKQARIRIVDDETGEWGIIAADHFVFSDQESIDFPPPEGGELAELVPAPAIAGNSIPEGTSLSIYADHDSHKVSSPTAMAFDEQGNLYVAETHRFRFGVFDDRDYRFWYFDDIAAQTTADRRKLYEKWQEKVPLSKLTEKSELIRRLTDKDGDGKADGMTVFADGFNDMLDGTAGGVFSYMGKTYFACIPKIYALEDRDGDGVADQREVLADGFGVRISLSGHDMNGFVLGNDGRLYGTIGDRGFSLTTREGKKYHHPAEGAVFRFDPDGSNFEVVHRGLRNPKEIAFDEFGNGVTVDNNSDQGDPARIVYIMDGVDSGWRMQHQALQAFREDIGLPEAPISPWMTEKMANLRNSDQPAFIVPPVGNLTGGPSGLTYHPGAGFLESEKGRFLVCDYKGSPSSSLIWSFKVKADGAGMKYLGAYKFNTGVAPTDVEYGFDGRLYVADFIGGWQSQDQGRIYSLTADKEKDAGLTPETAKLISDGLQKRSNADLARLFMNPDQRVRQRAHIILASRKDGLPALLSAARQSDLMIRLHGIWGLGIRARRNGDAEAQSALLALVADKHPEVRAQVAKILGELKGVSASGLLPLLADPSSRVRGFAAISLGRLKAAEAFDPAVKLIAENADKDLYLRHAAIMAMLGSGDAPKIAALSSHPSVPVRMAAVIALRRLESPEIGRFLNDPEPSIVDEAIRGIHDERIDEARPAVAALLDAYLDGKTGGRALKPMVCRRVIHTAFRLGGAQNAGRLVGAAASASLDLDQRVEMLRLLAQWPEPHPVDQSIGIWDPLPKRNLSEVAPRIEAGLPGLLAADEGILAPTLQLIEKLKLDRSALPAESLLRIAKTESLADLARSSALHLWLESKPASAEETLSALTTSASAAVAGEALGLLAKANPAKAVEHVSLMLKESGNAKRQTAWRVAGMLQSEAAAKLLIEGLERLTQPDPDRGVQLELLEGAAKSSDPAVKEKLSAYQTSLDAADPLSGWSGALDGGDATRGENLFYHHTSQCMRCHSIGDSGHGHGGDAGPNLAGIGSAHDAHYLLESLIVPGAQIAPGFGVISLKLKNGKTLGGILQSESSEHYDITVGNDGWRVKKSDVADATKPVSGMPPMTGLLTPYEARDIVAYLQTLKKPRENAPKPPEPKPYIP